MKNFKLKAILLLAILLCSGVSAFATEVWQNGIKYKLYYNGTAEATYADRDIRFADIPEKIKYAGEFYSVTSIESRTFYGCESLVSVSIPNSVTSIKSETFLLCENLVSVSIPNSVKSIGSSAFLRCYSLSSVSIPNSVTSIGEAAFANCRGLRELVCKAVVPPVCGKDAFYGVDKSECTLYVPQESMEDYKMTDQWHEFYLLETNIGGVKKSSVTDTETVRYSTDGTRLASPQKGINIIKMSDGTVKKVLVK